ncbi:hypothetical protein [Sanguibacter sp. HDW7]|uniref:hypothetical protein n=1 Tax=Sanguibacter sp. HDW7 TaxID=2714931 RepID=UPI0014073C44|nr:hypothetical protein [Sanguibacter sp. HDW7]QIK82383.1 hypothetical protein G7063_01225 [Sanguibacter sp. HDW7]
MYDIDTHGAWLGDAADDLSPERLERFADEWDAITARYADRDDDEEANAALSACVQYLLGETTVEAAGVERRRTQRAEMLALAAARQVARMAALDGMPKATAARVAGFDRMVLLRDLGERPARA